MKELTQPEQYILLSVHFLKEGAYLLSIRDHIKEITGKEFAIGTIYVPLERLRRLGYLDVRVAKPPAKVGGRSTKFYRLTESGFQVLHETKKKNDRLWTGFPRTDSLR